jgi:5-(carboxyamino)imidazole ribonucleotide synthase
MLAVPGASVHLYGKSPRPGRKVGHVTVVGVDAATVEASFAELCRLATSADRRDEDGLR